MNARFSRVLGIANPQAGVRRVRSCAIAACERAGLDFVIADTQYPGHATQLAARASEEGFDLVVAIGGDGTINEVGRALVHTEMPLGIVPAGSGNAFARELKLSLNPTEACEAFVRPRIRQIDAGRAGDALFFATAGIGLDAEVARRYAHRAGRRGFLPYVLLTARVLPWFQPEGLRLKLNGDPEIERRPLFVAIANMSQFGGGATIAPRAAPDDGELDVCVFTHPGWIRMALNTHRLFNNTFDHMPGVEMFRAKKIRIAREKCDWFQFDGEVAKGPRELAFEILPKALKVVVPETGKEGRGETEDGRRERQKAKGRDQWSGRVEA